MTATPVSFIFLFPFGIGWENVAGDPARDLRRAQHAVARNACAAAIYSRAEWLT
jgi:hypothetical protein